MADKQRKASIEDVRTDLRKSELSGDRKLILQELLSGADRCLDASNTEMKLDAVVEGTSDILVHLAREGIRTEKVMDDKIKECRDSHRCNFSWSLAFTVVSIAAGLFGLALRFLN